MTLMQACEEGKPEVIRMVLDRGASMKREYTTIENENEYIGNLYWSFVTVICHMKWQKIISFSMLLLLCCMLLKATQSMQNYTM